MIDQEVKKTLKQLGVSSMILTGIVLVGFGSFMYGQYLKGKLTKLQIKLAIRDLAETK